MSEKPKNGLDFEGSTVEEAISNATSKLGVSRGDITVKIICEEKKGLFGMEGAKPAKIKVFPKEKDNIS